MRALVRIKRGATIFQDHAIMKWPHCKAPEWEQKLVKDHYETANPDYVFEATYHRAGNGCYWDCTRYGYGQLGRTVKGHDSYGNGSIFVHGYDKVEIIEVLERDAVMIGGHKHYPKA